MAAVLTCLTVAAAVTGCAGGTGTEEASAGQMLDRANATMKALRSVTIDGDTAPTAGGGYTSHQTTDLKGRCASKVTWDTGAGLEQIRIGDTDYVRPNRVYLERWSGRSAAGTKDQKRWVRTPVSKARAEDGLAACTWPFASFGSATKGGRTKVGDKPAIALAVTDKADKAGHYTFYVATEGKPYLLKVVYKGPDYQNTISFSAFDEPLNVRPPARTDVLDASAAGH
ncbi:hypothetical protein ACH4UM_03185 [Streptomyces sp. NPDC020801]|uniref:hypothetical protein n=1 Tax=unclassified Streptomyces TaxID=2593676 RepID=UPI0037B877C8